MGGVGYLKKINSHIGGRLVYFSIILLEFGEGLDISPKKLPYLGGGVGKKSKFWGQLDQNDMSKFSFGGGMDH